MATCYHDEQDFDSDLKIEVAREGDLLKENQDLKEMVCAKNPGHHGFIPFKDLKLEHLPEDERCMKQFDEIKKIGSCVVRLVVNKIKHGEHIKTVGTGSVMKAFNQYYIQTNNHVVGTEEDVKHCSVEFFFESNNRSNIFPSQGTELYWTCPFRDITLLKFEPVPEFLTQFEFLDNSMMSPSIVMYRGNQIESYETGIYRVSRDISMVYITGINLNDPKIDIMYISFHNDSIGYLRSSYFKFQPIPSNIQDITNIEIHVDKDDGNSTVISGDVVKFGDEYVVKISESIFQDKVKKCRLVWNGEVISRGTRLYFQQFQSSALVEAKVGIDQEDKRARYPTDFWVFDYHPISRELLRCLETLEKEKPSQNMCCIGHPHGGIKMVTFGGYLGSSTERFDNHNRHIVNPREDCQCKEVQCVNYSCETCPGSSGSSVFNLYFDSLELPSCFAHFMGYNVRKALPYNKYIENINMAWDPS